MPVSKFISYHAYIHTCIKIRIYDYMYIAIHTHTHIRMHTYTQHIIIYAAYITMIASYQYIVIHI